MKQSRWKCPTCGHGLLAPTRPRRNDVRRYCLPCSSKAGVLVERVAPALDAQRAARDVARRERERKARERERDRKERALNAPREVAKRRYSKEGEYGMIIDRETARLWKLLAKIPTTLLKVRRTISRVTHNKPPKVVLFKKGWRVDEQQRVWHSGTLLGQAHQSGLIKVAPNVSWETLAHEIIHCAGYRGHDRAFYYALKWLTETRFKIIVDYSKVTRYGYAVDRMIEQQIDDIVRAEFKKPTEPEPE
jgi:hypothetical protein